MRVVANERGLTYDELLREMLDVYHSLAQRDAERRERLDRVTEAPNSGSQAIGEGRSERLAPVAHPGDAGCRPGIVPEH